MNIITIFITQAETDLGLSSVLVLKVSKTYEKNIQEWDTIDE